MEQKAALSQVLWDRSSSSVQGRLREPKLKSISVPCSSSQGSCSSAPQKNTVLRPDAPEFVPTWLKSATSDVEQKFQNVHISVVENPFQHIRHKAQDRLNKYKTPSGQSNEETSSCYSNPEAESNPNPQEPLNGYYEEEDVDEKSLDMMRLQQIIASLIKYPGQFDDLLMVFLETVYPYYSNILFMSKIAELLIGQAISSPNFRYNGVRLSWYVEQQCPAFRAELHLRCTKELKENLNRQNVVLFIAELYTQLPHDGLYGVLLIDALKDLVLIGGNENIKCVCQALKLTGYSLENNHNQDLDTLFFHLRTFNKSLAGSTSELLHSVINLRESNWGRTTAESSHSSDSSSDYDQHYEELVNGILYETEGQALTSEEQEFLVAHATSSAEYITDNDDPDGLCDPEPEMDEEIQAAFEEFVRLSKG